LTVVIATAGCRDAGTNPASAATSDTRPNADAENKADVGTPNADQAPVEAPKGDNRPSPPLWPKKGTLNLSFKDVEFEIEKGGDFEDEMLTDKIRALVGRRIKISGYMYSTEFEDGLENFILIQNASCPFGGPEALVYHNMLVNLKDGETTSYTTDAVTVEATLSIQPFPADRDEIELSIYSLSGATMKQ
jgi:hypothetical protein